MKFNKVVEFVYNHDYFETGQMPPLFTIAPLAQSSERLNDYGLTFRESNNGFYIAAKCAGDGGYFTVPPANSFVTVALYAIDPYLINFTQLPYITPGEKLFYGAGTSEWVVDKTHAPATATIKPKGILSNPQPFSVTSMFNKTVVAESQKGKKDSTMFPDPNLYYLNMSRWSDGVYKVAAVNPVEEQGGFFGTFAFMGRALMAKPPMALLTFSLPDASTAATVLQNIHYSMALTARSVFWQYQFSTVPSSTLTVNTDQAILSSQTGSGTPTKPVFHSPDVGCKSLVSDTAIKLTQAPWLGLALTDGSGTSIMNNLPNPQVENIYPYIKNPSSGITQPRLTDGEFYVDIPVSLPISNTASSPIANGVKEVATNG